MELNLDSEAIFTSDDLESYPMISDNSEEYDPYSEGYYDDSIFTNDLVIENEELNEHTRELLRHSVKTYIPFEPLGLIYQLDIIMGELFYRGLIAFGSLKTLELFASTRKLYWELFRRNYQYILNSMLKLRVISNCYFLPYVGAKTKKGKTYYTIDSYESQRYICVAKCTKNLCITPKTIIYMYMISDDTSKRGEMIYNFGNLCYSAKKRLDGRIDVFYYVEDGRLLGGCKYNEEAKELLLANY
jgi:hypothetical protein